MHSTQFIWNLRPKWTMMQQSGKTPPKDKSELLPNGMYDLKGNQPHLFAKFKKVKNKYQDAGYEQYQRQVMKEYNEMMVDQAKAPAHVRMRKDEEIPAGEPTEDTIQQISMARIKSFRDKAQQGNLTNDEKALLEKLTLESSTEFATKFPIIRDPETGKEIDSTDWLLNLFAPEVSAPVVQKGNIVSRVPRVPPPVPPMPPHLQKQNAPTSHEQSTPKRKPKFKVPPVTPDEAANWQTIQRAAQSVKTALSKFDQEKQEEIDRDREQKEKEISRLASSIPIIENIGREVGKLQKNDDVKKLKEKYAFLENVKLIGGSRKLEHVKAEMETILSKRAAEFRDKINNLKPKNNNL